MSESCTLPEFNLQQAAHIAKKLFAIHGPTRQLNGERDLNYLIEDERGKFVFKIANQDESPEMLECQHLLFERLATARAFPVVATALASSKGHLIEYIRSDAGVKHACRVLPFVEGRLLDDCDQLSSALLEDLGHCLAKLDLALEGFSHAALERPLLWEMRDALVRTEAFKPLLASDGQRQLVEEFEQGFRERVLAVENKLRRAVIHNDANKGNVLVDAGAEKVVSIIDFGDMVDSWLVAEPAIAATYAMLEQSEPLHKAQSLLGGYHRVLPLTPAEIDVVFDLICIRLCMSVCICAYQRGQAPDNAYLTSDEQAAWELLRSLSKVPYRDAQELMRQACRD